MAVFSLYLSAALEASYNFRWLSFRCYCRPSWKLFAVTVSRLGSFLLPLSVVLKFFRCYCRSTVLKAYFYYCQPSWKLFGSFSLFFVGCLGSFSLFLSAFLEASRCFCRPSRKLLAVFCRPSWKLLVVFVGLLGSFSLFLSTVLAVLSSAIFSLLYVSHSCCFVVGRFCFSRFISRPFFPLLPAVLSAFAGRSPCCFTSLFFSFYFHSYYTVLSFF